MPDTYIVLPAYHFAIDLKNTIDRKIFLVKIFVLMASTKKINRTRKLIAQKKLMTNFTHQTLMHDFNNRNYAQIYIHMYEYYANLTPAVQTVTSSTQRRFTCSWSMALLSRLIVR